MNKFTVEGVISLHETESVKIKTESGHELYILYANNELSVSNESNSSGDKNRYIAAIHNDGSMSVIDDISGDDLL